MSTLLSGPSCISPWIEDVAFQSLTKGVQSILKKPKLVQILSRGGHGWTTTNPNLTNNAQGQQSFLEIHDGQHFIKAFLNDTAQKSLGMSIPTYSTASSSSSNATETQQLPPNPPYHRAKRGSFVRVSDWTLAIQQQQTTNNEMNGIVVVMKINGAVDVMGGEDIGVIAHPVNVNESVQVRRVFQSSSNFSQLEHRFTHGLEQLGNVADLFTTTGAACTSNNSIITNGEAAATTATSASADGGGISSALENDNNNIQSILELAKKHKQQQNQEVLDGEKDGPPGNVQELLLDSNQVSSVLELALQQKCEQIQKEQDQYEREQQVIRSQQESLPLLSGVVAACTVGTPSSPSPQAPLQRIMDSDSTNTAPTTAAAAGTVALGNVADFFQNQQKSDNSDDNGGDTSTTARTLGVEKSSKGNVDVSQILSLAKQDQQQQKHPKVIAVVANDVTDDNSVATKGRNAGNTTILSAMTGTTNTTTKLGTDIVKNPYQKNNNRKLASSGEDEDDQNDDEEEEEEILGISNMLVEATQDNHDHGQTSSWKQSSRNDTDNDDEPISLETVVVDETVASSPKSVSKNKNNNNNHNSDEYDTILCTPPAMQKNKDVLSPFQPQNASSKGSVTTTQVNTRVLAKANHAACVFFAKLQHHARKGTTAYFDNKQNLSTTAAQPKHNNSKPEKAKKRPVVDIVGWLAKNSVRSPYKKPRISQ